MARHFMGSQSEPYPFALESGDLHCNHPKKVLNLALHLGPLPIPSRPLFIFAMEQPLPGQRWVSDSERNSDLAS